MNERLKDTKGFCNLVEACQLWDYINFQRESYFNTEHDEERSQPLCQLPNPRVDVCLYFLSPHTVSPLDIEVLGLLSKLVPTVPVVAKVWNPNISFALLPIGSYSGHLGHGGPWASFPCRAYRPCHRKGVEFEYLLCFLEH
jgi:hypothetical protein